MMSKHTVHHEQIIMETIEGLVPQDHLVRELEAGIEWSFIYPLVEGLYSKYGRPSVDPVVLFKMIFINKIFGINSMRRTCRLINHCLFLLIV